MLLIRKLMHFGKYFPFLILVESSTSAIFLSVSLSTTLIRIHFFYKAFVLCTSQIQLPCIVWPHTPNAFQRPLPRVLLPYYYFDYELRGQDLYHFPVLFWTLLVLNEPWATLTICVTGKGYLTTLAQSMMGTQREQNFELPLHVVSNWGEWGWIWTGNQNYKSQML